MAMCWYSHQGELKNLLYWLSVWLRFTWRNRRCFRKPRLLGKESEWSWVSDALILSHWTIKSQLNKYCQNIPLLANRSQYSGASVSVSVRSLQRNLTDVHLCAADAEHCCLRFVSFCKLSFVFNFFFPFYAVVICLWSVISPFISSFCLFGWNPP